MTELEQYHYDDVMADLAFAMEKYGARKFLQDFQNLYPGHMNELRIQFFRREQKQVAALLRTPEGT